MLFWNRWSKESTSRVYFNISTEKPAHTPDTPHVQPLSCKLEWTNQKHFYCFLLKPIRDNLAPGFPRALDLSPLHAQKSSGSSLFSRLSNKKWRFFPYFLILFMQRFVGYTSGWFSLFEKWSTLISCISLFLAVYDALYVSIMNRFSC